MALIEYDIQNDGTVTYRVLEVDEGDKIQYSSNDTNAAIQFKGASPFVGAPQKGQIIHVGKGKTEAFTVKEKLTKPIQFICGDHTEGNKGLTKSWGGDGGFIPPGRNGGNTNL